MSSAGVRINEKNKCNADTEILEIINSLGNSPSCTSEEKEFFQKYIEIKRIKKGTFLLKEGQIPKAYYTIYKGCVREFCTKDNEEKTTEFYIAGDTLSDESSMKNFTPSTLNWECVTGCIISVYPPEVEKEMYRRFPHLETLCRVETQNNYSSYRLSVHDYITSTPEERYENLLKNRPELFELVPQYQIASYIGIKAESLSRIRKRIMKTEKAG